MIAYLCPIIDLFELLYFQRNQNEPVKVDQLTVSLYLISDWVSEWPFLTVYSNHCGRLKNTNILKSPILKTIRNSSFWAINAKVSDQKLPFMKTCTKKSVIVKCVIIYVIHFIGLWES